MAPLRYFQQHDFASAHAYLKAVAGQAHVIKPAVSGGAWNTHLAEDTTDKAALDMAASILQSGGLIIQAFAPEVVKEGEWSFLVFDGKVSHHVLKTPNQKDFRSQPQFGSTITVPKVPEQLLASVHSTLAKLPVGKLPYVRVDGIQRHGELHLMEIEAIEPALFFEFAPEEAKDRFVEAVIAALRRQK